LVIILNLKGDNQLSYLSKFGGSLYISDQYAATSFQLKNGETLVGRIISENETAYQISQNPFAPDMLQKVLKKNVTSKEYSSVSLMMPGLINSLNEEELKNLMAYLVSGGNSKNSMFKQ
jgi:putative heme-binding domain-containing protein